MSRRTAVSAPFGTWRSPFDARVLGQGGASLTDVTVAGGAVYWNEVRPHEAGRHILMRWVPGGRPTPVVPEAFSARTLVHEYGGRCYAVHGGVIYSSNFEDQRIWRLPAGGEPVPLTPESPSFRSHRYVDPIVSPDGHWLFCVRERHESGEVVNELIAVDTQGREIPRVLSGGHDFFAAPRLHPSGRHIAWLTWDHPSMPWDAAQLWRAELNDDLVMQGSRLVAGRDGESVREPRWSPEGALYFVSDRSGWWNLYADDGAEGTPLAPMEAEFSGSGWSFGEATYAFLDDGRLVAAWIEAGRARLGLVGADGGLVEPLAIGVTAVRSLQAFGSRLVAIVGSPTMPLTLAVISPDGEMDAIRHNREFDFAEEQLSLPVPIEFPTTHGRSAHALFYPPKNVDFVGPPDERPPLVVRCHGGPTSAASPVLDLSVQFWTSRGLAVVDVDYGGSTGYGRAYRERLAGNWGIVDVEDCVNAAHYLVNQGEVDPLRLVIRGNSAGGYTTLCALTFRNVFAAGASLYGVGDLEMLTRQTHKFESHYLDQLIGSYPDASELYYQRSPVHFADQISCPVILFQGSEDEIVPPNQAEMIVEALRRNGVPFAYITYQGEQHGFRRAENITRTAELELWFYGQVLGFLPADDIEPVTMENRQRLGDLMAGRGAASGGTSGPGTVP